MHERKLHRTRPVTRSLLLGAALMASACLDRDGGQVDTGFIGLTTTETSPGVSDSTSTTLPGIMTTTFEPVDSSSGTDDPSGTTEAPIPPGCGNGVVDGEEEECDEGEANANDAQCTAACKWASCGDGYVRDGLELCDEGEDNGAYEHCASDCSGPGPRCGDLELQADEGEACDADATSGCLQDCTKATTCVELKTSWGDAAGDGIYTIYRKDQELTVWCAMEADGGGYTILKHAALLDDQMNPEWFSAKKAEMTCDLYGMHLLVPRSPAHLAAVAAAANNPAFGNTNLGGVDGKADAYLRIFGIYPVAPPQTCLGAALNSDACGNWKTKDGKPYYLTDVSLNPAEPSENNCLGCSMDYLWSKTDPPVLTGYVASDFVGQGAVTPHFLCEIGDKLPPPPMP